MTVDFVNESFLPSYGKFQTDFAIIISDAPNKKNDCGFHY